MKAKIDWSLQRQQLGEAMARVYRKENTVNEEADSMIDYLISCFDAPIEAAEETIAGLREEIAALKSRNEFMVHQAAGQKDYAEHLRAKIHNDENVITTLQHNHDEMEKTLRRKLRKVRRKLRQSREEREKQADLNPLENVPASHTFTGTASEMYDRVGEQIKESGLKTVGDVPQLEEMGTLKELDLNPGDKIEEVETGLVFIVPGSGSSMSIRGRELVNHSVLGPTFNTKDDPLGQKTDHVFRVISRVKSLTQEVHGYVAT